MDREKVIKALEFCTSPKVVDTCYGECPYAVADDEYKCLEMKLDALALLKEQEEEIENLKQTAQNMMEGIVVSTRFCKFCGREVKFI